MPFFPLFGGSIPPPSEGGMDVAFNVWTDLGDGRFSKTVPCPCCITGGASAGPLPDCPECADGQGARFFDVDLVFAGDCADYFTPVDPCAFPGAECTLVSLVEGGACPTSLRVRYTFQPGGLYGRGKYVPEIRCYKTCTYTFSWDWVSFAPPFDSGSVTYRITRVLYFPDIDIPPDGCAVEHHVEERLTIERLAGSGPSDFPCVEGLVGDLSPCGDGTFDLVGTPACFEVLCASSLYGDYGFSIDPGPGAVTACPGDPFTSVFPDPDPGCDPCRVTQATYHFTNT